MTIKERIVRIDAYDGLFDKSDLTSSDAIDTYYKSLVEHEDSINNDSTAQALRFCGDMECSEVGALVLQYSESDACDKGAFDHDVAHDSYYLCALTAGYLISRIMEDESYTNIVKPIDVKTYYNTSGVLDERGKSLYVEDCGDRRSGIFDMATMLMSETMEDDECIMSFRLMDSEDGTDDIPETDASEYDQMSDHELMVEVLKQLVTLKTITFEVLKTLATLR